MPTFKFNFNKKPS